MTELDTERDVASHARPWGSYSLFALNETSSVKIISVDPGARLSKQVHAERSELWEVLDGPMNVEVDGRSWSAVHGERIWVPVGAVHRMGNSTGDVARILEVAFGRFDEDDIVRLEDDYAR